MRSMVGAKDSQALRAGVLTTIMGLNVACAGVFSQRAPTMCEDELTGPFQWDCNFQLLSPEDAQLGCFENIPEMLFTYCDLGPKFPAQQENDCKTLCELWIAVGPTLDCAICGIGSRPSPGGDQDRLCCPSDPPGPRTIPYQIGYEDTFRVDSAGSTGSLTVDDETVTTTLSRGDVNYRLDSCSGDTCQITFTFIRLFPDDFSIKGKDITRAFIQSGGPIPGVIHLPSGLFRIEPGDLTLFLFFDIDGEQASIPVSNDGLVVTGFSKPEEQLFLLVGTVAWEADGLSASLDLRLEGSFENQGPPEIVLDAPSTVECLSPDGTPVVLDASSTHDPDEEPLRFLWFDAATNARIAEGPRVEVLLGFGEHRLRLDVFDLRSMVSREFIVTVVDTQGPVITASIAPTCLWPPNNRWALYELGEQIQASAIDACSGKEIAVGITSVAVDDPLASGDAKFDGDSVCLKSARRGALTDGRTYSIQLGAADGCNNVSTSTLEVVVPHDLRLSQCAGSGGALSLSSEDPRCDLGSSPLAPPSTGTCDGPSHPPHYEHRAASARVFGCAIAAGRHPGDGLGSFALLLFGLTVLYRVPRRTWTLLLLLLACSGGCSARSNEELGGDEQDTPQSRLVIEVTQASGKETLEDEHPTLRMESNFLRVETLATTAAGYRFVVWLPSEQLNVPGEWNVSVAGPVRAGFLMPGVATVQFFESGMLTLTEVGWESGEKILGDLRDLYHGQDPFGTSPELSISGSFTVIVP